MAEPIVFVTTSQVHPGSIEAYRDSVRRSMAFLEANGPQLLASVYLDEQTGVATAIQVHRDSQSILSTWQLADPHIRDVMQHITTTRVEIFGSPNPDVMAGMERLAGSGAELIVRPRLAGFMRS